MRHDPILLSERVKKVINTYSLLVFNVILTGVMILQTVFDRNQFNNTSFYGIVLLGLIFSIFGMVRYFDIGSINNKPWQYLLVYHAIFGIGFAMFAPAYTPYLLIWLVMVFLANFFYGLKGALLSLSGLLLVLLNQSFRLLPHGSGLGVYIKFVLVQFVLFAAVSLFLSETEKVGDQDRKVFVTSIDKAQLERQRLVSLINSMGDGVISTDDAGVIKLYNAAALSILDTNSTLQDKNIRDILTTIDQNAKTVDLISEADEKNANITSTEYLLVYPNGEKINLYINISPIKLSFRQNTERGFIIAFRDITREKSLEEERNEFISVVSHELRTPIAITEANISNAQFIAEKGDNPGAIKSSLEAAHKQSLFLANMINDLSTLSRAERGILQMDTEEISPSEVLQSIKSDYQKEADVKGLELTISQDDDIPSSIVSNRLYVREILQNFVTNAIKYTKEGSVDVHLSKNENGVEFAVKDSGIGISKSDQKRVFDKFFRSEDFRTRESSGTGLGLYVTKKIMKLINAEISLESKLNEGTTFTVLIPNLDKNIQK
jgi:two-component system, OmpR family, phosphate regulon sensor histidine kinase PhoR